MKATKRNKLEAAGWRVGSADDFLGLAEVESALVELRLALSHAFKIRRAKLRLSQRALAVKLASSQSRIAKMEAADPEVTIDLLLRGLLATGASRRDLARLIAAPARGPGRAPSQIGSGPAVFVAPAQRRYRQARGVS